MSIRQASWGLFAIGLFIMAVSGSLPAWADDERLVQDWQLARECVELGEGFLFLSAALRFRDGGWRLPMLSLLLSFIYGGLYPNASAFFHYTPLQGWVEVQRHCVERCIVVLIPSAAAAIAYLEGKDEDDVQ